MSLKNLDLTRLKLSSWRKVALGTWRTPRDPSVYGSLEVNASTFLKRREMWIQKRPSEKPPTLTVVMARATALTFKKHPQINGLIRWGQIYNRKTVSLFIQTSVDEEGKELSGVVIENAEDKSLTQMMSELSQKAKAIREDRDEHFKKAKGMTMLVPPLLVGVFLRMLSFFIYTLNLNLSFLGLPKDPFGSVMITSVGMLGIDEGFAPLVPYSRVPAVLAVGAIRDKPIVVDGKISIAPIFKLCATFDHRFIDGIYGAKMVRTMKGFLESEEGLDAIGL